MVRLLRTGDETTRMSLGVDGIETLLEQARAAEFAVESTIGLSPGELPSPVESVVFRVVQEAITNVLRHSAGTCLGVDIRLSESDVAISVVDNGVGANDPAAGDHGPGTNGSDTTGHGLQGMSERVRLIGGHLNTHSRPGAQLPAGTRCSPPV